MTFISLSEVKNVDKLNFDFIVYNLKMQSKFAFLTSYMT